MRNFSISFGYENPLRRRFGAEFFAALPGSSGVYFMRGEGDEILYIGKAKSLKARLGQYAQAKPGAMPEHILEMIESVRRIEWRDLSSEAEALEFESELLHAIRPPYNIAQTESEHYLYIGIRPSGSKLDFQLSSHPRMSEAGYEVYGCFKHRARVKRGYSALLRVIHAALASGRFSYPARICRASPAWLYTTEFRPEWGEDLHRFLSGRDTRLLDALVESLLENDSIPRFMRPSIQDDLETVRELYRIGPGATRELKRRFGVRSRILSHRQMDTLIERDLRARLKRPA